MAVSGGGRAERCGLEQVGGVGGSQAEQMDEHPVVAVVVRLQTSYAPK